MVSWTGFSKKSPQERWEHLEKYDLLNQQSLHTLKEEVTLPLLVADQMAENVIATHALPFSLAPDFLINDQNYTVPMVTEEPSVVLAASFAAKMIKRSGGFTTTIHNRLMIGQVALYDVPEPRSAQAAIRDAESELLALAAAAHPSIVKRGGGPRKITTAIKEDFLIVYLSVDPKEAMGANMLNTMLEALSPRLEDISQGRSLMSILSNYATESLVTATCAIDLRHLSRNREEALSIGEKIQAASRLAQVDPYRAATHNKGIMNGIDAVVLATGNDWRAIEAGAHAYAAQDGAYRGLSQWVLNREEGRVEGRITLPMPIATRGGSIGLNPSVSAAFEILGQPDARELASIIASVGLAQNFAAIRALVTQGIQAGHMKLQAKSLALQAGATGDEVAQVSARLVEEKTFNLARAQEILNEIR